MGQTLPVTRKLLLSVLAFAIVLTGCSGQNEIATMQSNMSASDSQLESEIEKNNEAPDVEPEIALAEPAREFDAKPPEPESASATVLDTASVISTEVAPEETSEPISDPELKPASESTPESAPGATVSDTLNDTGIIANESVDFVGQASESDPQADTPATSIEMLPATPVTSDKITSRYGGNTLRSYADPVGFWIGFAARHEMHLLDDVETYQAIGAAEYNIVTPENGLKMSIVQPERGQFVWDHADRVFDYAEKNDMAVHGHVLLWHEQAPDWARQLDEPERAIAMGEHITTVMSRYKGRVAVWDVLNEPLQRDGSLRVTLWYSALKERYINEAFNIAREADPNAALIVNEYAVGWENPKSDALYQLVKQELVQGTPIDGVGFEFHISREFNLFDSVRRNMQRFADLGLDIYITEFDVSNLDGAYVEDQTRVYSQILEICLQQPRCRAFQSWGLSDRYSWRGSLYGLPLDKNYQAKPAWYAMQTVLGEQTSLR